MTVTSHVYPNVVSAMFDKTINLVSDTFKAVLFTGDASAWTDTEEGYQYLSDLTAAYTECTDADYARLTISDLSISNSGNKTIWTCSSPISFGSSVTITARSMAIVDVSVGSGDSSHPVIAIIDFGEDFSSSDEPWGYTVDPVNGLLYATSG